MDKENDKHSEEEDSKNKNPSQSTDDQSVDNATDDKSSEDTVNEDNSSENDETVDDESKDSTEKDAGDGSKAESEEVFVSPMADKRIAGEIKRRSWGKIIFLVILLAVISVVGWLGYTKFALGDDANTTNQSTESTTSSEISSDKFWLISYLNEERKEVTRRISYSGSEVGDEFEVTLNTVTSPNGKLEAIIQKNVVSMVEANSTNDAAVIFENKSADSLEVYWYNDSSGLLVVTREDVGADRLPKADFVFYTMDPYGTGKKELFKTHENWGTSYIVGVNVERDELYWQRDGEGGMRSWLTISKLSDGTKIFDSANLFDDLSHSEIQQVEISDKYTYFIAKRTKYSKENDNNKILRYDLETKKIITFFDPEALELGRFVNTDSQLIISATEIIVSVEKANKTTVISIDLDGKVKDTLYTSNDEALLYLLNADSNKIVFTEKTEEKTILNVLDRQTLELTSTEVNLGSSVSVELLDS